MRPFTFVFSLITTVALCANPAAAQQIIDDFTIDQGPLVGGVSSPGDTVNTAGSQILGGSRSYTSFDTGGGTFAVTGGTATIDPGTSVKSSFLVYDANNTGLNLDITGHESIVLDVASISGNRLDSSVAVFLSSPGGGSSTNDFFPLHEGQNVFDLKDFFDASETPADFTALSRITVQIETPADATVSLDSLSLTSQLGASLGNRVWHDTNGNGQQDSGEPRINNATVTLLGDLDGGGTADDIVAVTQTISTGAYSFDNLPAGDYALQYTLPTGFDAASPQFVGDPATDSDVDTSTLVTSTFTLVEDTNDFTRDAGFFRFASVGDFVWLDLNENGIQDDGEPGIEGAEVRLDVLAQLPFGGPEFWLPIPSATTTTDLNGEYLIDELMPGEEYRVRFVTPDGMVPTLTGQGGADVDSDGLNSALFAVTSGQVVTGIDAGFFIIPEPASAALLALGGLGVATRRKLRANQSENQQ